MEDRLFRIDVERKLYLTVGALGAAGMAGLAYAPSLGLMYGIDDSIDTDDMVTVNLATGAAATFGRMTFGQVRALAFDTVRSTLYGADFITKKLIRIDPFTGAGTAVGLLGLSSVQGLTFDPQTDTLHGADTTTNQLITIDVTTGAGTAVGPFGGDFDNVQGLAFDTLTHTLYGMQNNGGGVGRLIRIDTANGQATPFNLLYGDSDPTALAFVPGLTDATVGTPYSAPIPLAGGCPPYTYSNATGLPQGLSISSSGLVLGIPAEAGDFTLGLDIGDSRFDTPGITGSLPLRVRPANDGCAEACVVGVRDTAFTTLGALTDGPDEPTLCTFFGVPKIEYDVWFCHPAACTGQLTVSLCDSDYDTKLAVYGGCACPTSSSAIACNDDACGTSGGQSEVTLAVTNGQSYLIRVGGFPGNAGSGTLSISCTECTLDADCDDGNLCTDNHCTDGVCSVTQKSCDDGNLYTTDHCAPATGCSNTPIHCDDEDACTTEACNVTTGICDVTPISCDDIDVCTTDSCDPDVGCVHAAVSCDDGDPCTTDACDATTGCSHTFGGQPDTDCNDDGTDDACDVFLGTSLDCNDNDIPDECDVAIGADGRFEPVDFSAHHNVSLQAHLDGGYPSGDIILGGVPFSIPNTENNYWHSQNASGANPRSIDIAVNRPGVWEVHTIINTYWGQPGPASYASLEFFGSDGAYFLKDLIGNEDICDFNQNVFTNNTNGTTTINIVSLGNHRLDKQRIVLPADFHDETLLTVRMSDNGAEGFQRAFLAGITTLVSGSGDCNGNAAPDECDIADGTSHDGDGHGVPDDCTPCGWVNWPVSSGGNGHYYLAVPAPGGIDWNDASAAAAAPGAT